jgi:hypothetical protein
MLKKSLVFVIGLTAGVSSLQASAQGLPGAVANGVRQVCSRNVYGQLTCWVVANEAYSNYVGPSVRSAGRGLLHGGAYVGSLPYKAFNDPVYGAGNTTPQVYGRRNCYDPRYGTYFAC